MMLLGLNAVGAIARLPNRVFRGHTTDPEETNRDPVREWVAVRRGSKLLAARTIDGEGGYPMTVSATVSFAKRLAQENANQRGCFDPQEVVSLGEFRSDLAASGVDVKEVPAPAAA